MITVQYNTILQLLFSLTNVIGTTYAVLSILRLTPTELYKSLTIEGMDKNDKSLLTQKKQARVGISLISWAWLWQAAFSFITIQSCCKFVISLLVYIVTTLTLVIVLYFWNNRFSKKYHEAKKEFEKQKVEKHSETHRWGEF